MILPKDFLAELFYELAEEYEHEPGLCNPFATLAYKHYRDIEDVEGMQKCNRFLD